MNEVIEIIQTPKMTWISLKDRELPLSKDILVKWEVGPHKGKTFVSAIKQMIDDEEKTFFFVPGVTGLRWNTDFEAENVTHFMFIDD